MLTLNQQSSSTNFDPSGRPHGLPGQARNDESKAACSWPRSSAVATQRILLPVRRLEDRRGVGEPHAGVGVLKTGEKYAKFNIAAVNGLKYLRIK